MPPASFAGTVYSVRRSDFMDAVADPARSVLLVEDDSDVLDVLSESLENAGYRIHRARTIYEARRTIARRRYDLVVADIRLPDGWGYQLLDDARAAGTKFIFMTGYIDELPSVRMTQTSYLLKPFSLDTLLGEVREQLGAGLSGGSNEFSGSALR
jgi:DNA-binding NtrC family response regulator